MLALALTVYCLMCAGFCCCIYITFLVIALVISAFPSQEPPIHAASLEDAQLEGHILDLQWEGSLLDSQVQGYLHDFGLESTSSMSIVVILMVSCCSIRLFCRLMRVGCRGSTVVSSLLSSLLLGLSAAGCYNIYTGWGVNSLQLQFILALAVIVGLNSSTLIGALNPRSSFGQAVSNCFCCFFILCLVTAAMYFASTASPDETYLSLIEKYSFIVLGWIAKYGVCLVLISWPCIFISERLNYGYSSESQVPNTSSAQVTQFALTTLTQLSKYYLILAGMLLCYWVFTLVFVNPPYLLSFFYTVLASIVVSISMTDLSGWSRPTVLRAQGEVLLNTFALVCSLLSLSLLV
jgi:hypothetical protein